MSGKYKKLFLKKEVSDMIVMNTEVIADYIGVDRSFLHRDVYIKKINSQEFNFEYSIRSHWYKLIVICIAGICAAKNLTLSFLHKIFYDRKKSIRKILWNMGRNPKHTSTFFVDGISSACKEVKVHAASWKALDICYNYNKDVQPSLNGGFNSLATKFWLGKLQNRQAISNRKKLVVELMVEIFGKFKDRKEIRLISIASGSAQAVIEAINQSKYRKKIKVVLIDVDKEALFRAKKLIENNGLESQFTIIRGTPKAVDKVSKSFKPDIIEMIGFLDYFTDEKARRLIKYLKGYLPRDGFFLTGNINKNVEKMLLDWCFLWPMVYRSRKRFAKVLLSGGFEPSQINIFYEPFGIHSVSVCRC